MKHAQAIVLGIFICLGCGEDKTPLPPTNSFVGTWWGELAGDGVNVDVSFEVSGYEAGKEEYIFQKIAVDYSKVPWQIVPQGLTYTVETGDRFADNDGFAEVIIRGAGQDMWVNIIFKHIKIFKNDGGWSTPGGIPIGKGIPYLMSVTRSRCRK